jgi:uncharacterized membrane protein YczE
VIVRVLQLVVSCVVLGVGVALLLTAALGSDGYSTLVNGLALSLDVPFVVANTALGVVLVAMAWLRGVTPGIGTVGQPLVVGFTVSAGLDVLDEPAGLPARCAMLGIAFVVLAVGVAGYLGSATGAGPTEAAALAFDPPVPFRWSYSVVQGGGAVVGGLGPAVDLVARVVPAIGQPAHRSD